MGCEANITHDRFPKQGGFVGRRVEVCFHYDTGHVIGGEIVRDDREAPGETIIRLDNGRYVRSAECQYTMPPSSPIPTRGRG